MLSKAAKKAAPAMIAGALRAMASHDAFVSFALRGSFLANCSASPSSSRASGMPGAPSKNTPPQIKKTLLGKLDSALVRRGPITWHTVKLVVYIATTRPRTASLGKAVIHASPKTNNGAIDAPNIKRSTVQPHSDVTYCRGMTDAAA